MEKIIGYLWRNFKYAGKTVFSKFREYLPFLVALFVIQTVFFTTFVTTATNYKNRYESITEEYDYDILLDGLSYNQYIVLEQSLSRGQLLKNRVFESYRISKVSDAFGDSWRVYVVMRDGESNDFFLRKFVYSDLSLGDTSSIDVSFTPLNEYRNSSEFYDKTPSIWLLTALTLISAASLLALYNVRVNHDRFRYGIYVTFGAGFKRLFSTSVFEMMVVSFIALVPSALFTFGLASLFYGKYAIDVVLEWQSVIKVIIMNLIVVGLVVFLPMKSVSRKTPMSLLLAEDNSNLVSSPRGTQFIAGDVFLRIYEMLGMWRFRKYYLKLLVSAVAFSAIFVCGVYITDMNSMKASAPIEEFRFESKKTAEKLSSDSSLYEGLLTDLNFFSETFSTLDGVSHVEYNVSAHATDVGGMVLLNERESYRQSANMASTNDLKNTYEYTHNALKDYNSDGYTKATNMYKYAAYDENMLSVLESMHDIDGDVYSVINKENTVIVSETVMNSRGYRFEVGDKIVLARIVEAGKSGNYVDPFDTVGVIGSMLSTNEYAFEEYTVGAVIKDLPETAGYFTVGLSFDEYETLTTQKAVPTSASVYLENGVSKDEYEALRTRAQQVRNYYSHDFSLVDTYGYLYGVIDREKCSYEFGIALSLLVLIVSPIVWFYSQSLFYKKREKEMYVLSAYGATAKVFRKIHKTSAALLSAVAFIFTALLGVAASYVIYKFLNEWIAYLGFGSDSSYAFYVSLPALALCLALSVVCGFVSSYLPYRRLVRSMGKPKKSKNKDEAADADENCDNDIIKGED